MQEPKKEKQNDVKLFHAGIKKKLTCGRFPNLYILSKRKHACADAKRKISLTCPYNNSVIEIELKSV